MIDDALMAQVAKLSPADRLELIGALWDTLDHQGIPVSEREKAILDARLADARVNPADQAPWSEVRERLLRRSR